MARCSDGSSASMSGEVLFCFVRHVVRVNMMDSEGATCCVQVLGCAVAVFM